MDKKAFFEGSLGLREMTSIGPKPLTFAVFQELRDSLTSR